MKSFKKYNNFITYINNYWFSKVDTEYNYYSFIVKFKENDPVLNRLYLTNNIIESIHQKLNSKLNNQPSNKLTFINALKNIFINDIIKNDTVKRYDFITKSLINLIEKEDLLNNIKWIDYDTFKFYLKKNLEADNYTKFSNVDNFIRIIELESENFISKDNYNLYRKYNNNNNENESKENINITNKINKKFVGFINLGKTCYINSILQILYHISLFRENILLSKTNKQKNNCLQQLKNLFFKYKNNKNINYLNTENFVNNFENENIDVNEQHDANEFFLNLLDKIEFRFKNTSNENLIKYLFQIRIKNTISFNNACNHIIIEENNIFCLNLDIGLNNNLNNSLYDYTSSKNLDINNKVYCSKCKKNNLAIKKIDIINLPKYLIVLLERFKYDNINNSIIKINKYFEFNQNLSLKDYIIDNKKNMNNNQDYLYKLKSIIIHKGSAISGHYFGLINDYEKELWFKCDDKEIKIIDKNFIPYLSFGNKVNLENDFNNDSSAYMIFYEKYNDNFCDLFDNVDIPDLTKNINLNTDINHLNNFINLNSDMSLDNCNDDNLAEDCNIDSFNENDMDSQINSFDESKEIINNTSKINTFNNYIDFYDKFNKLSLMNNEKNKDNINSEKKITNFSNKNNIENSKLGKDELTTLTEEILNRYFYNKKCKKRKKSNSEDSKNKKNFDNYKVKKNIK